MVIRSAVLHTVCGVTSRLPGHEEPEFAFVGRSNVGKSSLLNTLVQRKSLARTSGQPGKTATVNYYLVNDRVFLVDLPGYGYARTGQAVREQWGKMTERYLAGSPSLRLIFQLVDIRHDPSAQDVEMARWIAAAGKRTAVIATKADKISRGAADKQLSVIRKALKLPPGTPVIPFSAQTRSGREEVWQVIEACLAQEEVPEEPAGEVL